MLRCDDFDTLVQQSREYCDMLALVFSGPPLSPEQKTDALRLCTAVIRSVTEVIEHIEEKPS